MVYSLGLAGALNRNTNSGFAVVVVAVGMVVALLAAGADRALATTYYANPGESITTLINGMSPGDTLILNPGDYYSPVIITSKNGSPGAWFTIRGPDIGTARLIANSGTADMIEIRQCSYLRLENFEIDGNNMMYAGVDGINCKTGPSGTSYVHHLVIDGVEVHHVAGNGISTKVTAWDIEVRNCYIHDTGYPGLYLGNSDGSMPIMNLTFENNFVERTFSYNIQVKHQNTRFGVALGDTPGLEFESWGWLMKDNVLMRNEPTDWDRPNLLIDAGPLTGSGIDDVATICGNVVLGNTSPASAESGFQVSGNLQIYNNVVMGIVASGFSGIKLTSHVGIIPRNFEIYNNTVFLLSAPTGASCLSLYSANTTPGLMRVVASNALIHGSASGTAFVGTLPAGTVVTSNIVRGSYGGLAGFTEIADPLGDVFINPVETPGLVNLYPAAGSPLIGAGDNALAPSNDFNGVLRPQGGVVEVGAYEVIGPSNPGWQIDLEFKQTLLLGDLDYDGDVDLDDYTLLAAAMAGPGSPAGEPDADLDGDNDCDMADYAIFAIAMYADYTPPDETPPAAITDLAAQTSTSQNGAVDLSWTAPGDDGSEGLASSYDLRYSSSLITEGNWDSATPVAGLAAPAYAGTAQEFAVSGLTPSQLYYFAIKTSDEVPNESDLSNVPSAAAADLGTTEIVLQNGLDGYTGCDDVHLNDREPSSNYGSNLNLWVSAYHQTVFDETQRTLIRFDLSSLAPGTTIASAELMLYTWQEHGPEGVYDAHLMPGPWVEGEATWSASASGQSWTSPGGDYDPTIIDSCTKVNVVVNVWMSWDITDTVQDWVDSVVPNYGVLLKGAGDETQGVASQFHSSEYGATSVRPQLVITVVNE